MDPNTNETWAELIARRPERLNILIAARDHTLTSDPHYFHRINLRYGYTELVDEGLPGETRCIGGSAVYSPSMQLDADQIRAVVAEIRHDWGQDLHVQDNSGLVPDLHQGLFRG